MTKLMRKNLIVDNEKVKELARLRGRSESAVVREAVDFALAAAVAEDVFRKLHARGGGVDDVFGKLPAEEEEERPAERPRRAGATHA
jgi:hypothetical protein